MGFEIFLFWLIFAILVGVYASTKGRSGFGFFLTAVFLSPLIGFIIALVVEPIRANVEHRELASGEFKKCPFCAELVRAEAIVCKHCGRDLPAEAVKEKTPISEEHARLHGLCAQLRAGELTYQQYQQLAQAVGSTLGLSSSSFFASYVVTHREQKVVIKRFNDLKPWFLSNVVPNVESKA